LCLSDGGYALARIVVQVKEIYCGSNCRLSFEFLFSGIIAAGKDLVVDEKEA
jgi:hypothetical protein